jgi:hypothetical protein
MSIKHLRLLGLVTSAAAFAAFGAPSTALAGKSHHLNPYKVEMHVELEGEDGEYTLDCKSNDLAVDGMYRIDNVDQDNDWEDPDPGLAAFWANPASPSSIGTSPDLTIRKSVRPMAAYSDSVDKSRYHFAFTPLAGADVQIKLWVICIPQPLTGFGHTHTWQFTIDPAYHTQSIAAAAPSDDPGASMAPADPGYYEASCPAKTILINPGFRTTFTNHHIVTSRPFPSTLSWNGRGWVWRVWDDSGAGGSATFSWRCMDVKSSTPSGGGSHTHKVVFNKKETTWDGLPASDAQVGPQQVSERQQHCGEHYKALLGGWDVSGTWRMEDLVGPMTWPHHMWVYFLGMDPRIKTRAFSFLNLDEIYGTVGTAVVCFKDRTT